MMYDALAGISLVLRRRGEGGSARRHAAAAATGAPGIFAGAAILPILLRLCRSGPRLRRPDGMPAGGLAE